MADNYTKEQITIARKTNLYEYLRKYHVSDFKVEGASIHPRNNHSLSIKRGYSGYTDFATGEHGNSVDFLVKYMGYTTVEAVLALCGGGGFTIKQATGPKIDTTTDAEIVLPTPVDGMYKQLFMYLTKIRGITADTVKMLINTGLIYQFAVSYQGKIINNIAFVNKERDFCETHGTNSYKSFHGIIPHSRKNGFWWFQPEPNDKADAIYVCEAAIDAISLFELHRKEGKTGSYIYVSIAGCAKQGAIDRIKNGTRARVILAVDNDAAGQQCRDKNSDLEHIIPTQKDWNDDLLAKKESLSISVMKN